MPPFDIYSFCHIEANWSHVRGISCLILASKYFLLEKKFGKNHNKILIFEIKITGIRISKSNKR